MYFCVTRIIMTATYSVDFFLLFFLVALRSSVNHLCNDLTNCQHDLLQTVTFRTDLLP